MGKGEPTVQGERQKARKPVLDSLTCCQETNLKQPKRANSDIGKRAPKEGDTK